jgi:hypothetical protein
MLTLITDNADSLILCRKKRIFNTDYVSGFIYFTFTTFKPNSTEENTTIRTIKTMIHYGTSVPIMKKN